MSASTPSLPLLSPPLILLSLIMFLSFIPYPTTPVISDAKAGLAEGLYSMLRSRRASLKPIALIQHWSCTAPATSRWFRRSSSTTEQTQEVQVHASCRSSRCSMSVRARLLWARDLVARNTRAHLALASAAEHGRGKVKLLLHHSESFSSPVPQSLILGALDYLIGQEPHFVTVDRGHKHESSNTSEVCIWLSSRDADDLSGWHPPSPPQPPRDGPDGGDDDHDVHPRRGRSPPSAQHDPWSGASDPWSQRPPPSKQPRYTYKG